MIEKKPEKDDRLPKGQDKLDRPLECGQCQKPANIHYCEIVGEKKQCFAMCKDCPQLQQKMHGTNPTSNTHASAPGTIAGSLTCGNCGTTLEAVRMGQPLGCGECYGIFSTLLLNELVHAELAPQRLLSKKNTVPAHVGRTPGEGAEINPSVRLIALNDALSETLGREDYEQAAWIRDQIKELTKEEQNGATN